MGEKGKVVFECDEFKIFEDKDEFVIKPKSGIDWGVEYMPVKPHNPLRVVINKKLENYRFEIKGVTHAKGKDIIDAKDKVLNNLSDYFIVKELRGDKV